MHSLHPSQLPPDDPTTDRRPDAKVIPLKTKQPDRIPKSISSQMGLGNVNTIDAGDGGKPWQRVFMRVFMRSEWIDGQHVMKYTDGEYYIDAP